MLSVGRGTISPEHWAIIRKLQALGIAPTYILEFDRALLKAAESKALEQEVDKTGEYKVCENTELKKDVSQDVSRVGGVFDAEASQNAALNKFFLLGLN